MPKRRGAGEVRVVGPEERLHAAARAFFSDFQRADDGAVVSLSELTSAAVAFGKYEQERIASKPRRVRP